MKWSTKGCLTGIYKNGEGFIIRVLGLGGYGLRVNGGLGGLIVLDPVVVLGCSFWF